MPIQIESALHASLKSWYAQSGDQVEVPVDGYYIDLVRGDLLIEIQTGNFSGIRKKLLNLLPLYQVRLVYPLPQVRYIRRISSDGLVLSYRKSPLKGRWENLFNEFIYLADLICDEHFSFEALMITEEIEWVDDGRGSWRRKGWSIQGRRLLGVMDQRIFNNSSEFLAFLPGDLPRPFTVKELSYHAKIRRRLAGKIAYSLRKMFAIQVVGREGNAYRYQEIENCP